MHKIAIGLSTLLLTGVDAVAPTETAASLSSSIKSFARRVTTWVNTCADHYAAATLYEQLSKLSDTELHRRGLSRDALARDVCGSCEWTAGR